MSMSYYGKLVKGYMVFSHSLKTSILQAHSEWPSSGYKQLERGLLVDLGFYSTSLVSKGEIGCCNKC